MAAPRLAQTQSGMHPVVRQFTVKTGEVPVVGDFVHLDATPEIIRTVAADPAAILGLALEPARTATDPLRIEAMKILVAVATEDLILAMEGSAAPVAADVNVSYGISRPGTYWIVDKTEAVNTRVHVVGIDIPNAIFLVKILAANRQMLD